MTVRTKHGKICDGVVGPNAILMVYDKNFLVFIVAAFLALVSVNLIGIFAVTPTGFFASVLSAILSPSIQSTLIFAVLGSLVPSVGFSALKIRTAPEAFYGNASYLEMAFSGAIDRRLSMMRLGYKRDPAILTDLWNFRELRSNNWIGIVLSQVMSVLVLSAGVFRKFSATTEAWIHLSLSIPRWGM